MKAFLTFLPGMLLVSLATNGSVDFNREVRPLLASKCYACHGPDEEGRKAKLRLDVREDALKNDVIVPGEIENSEFHYRIHSDDPEEIMPPPNPMPPSPRKRRNYSIDGLRKALNMQSTGLLSLLPPVKYPKEKKDGSATRSMPSSPIIFPKMT